ncbi:hypothetical protein CDD80_7028 [Ophiocordyceps camponoti-rufipedis]|uniref:UBC core domain-containing protein n=1 Tax=Ophiocordyceps camponoti-rufipedis TaxID=2004952 RepID=A0A2C5ZF41_9HYPO|nr:hypothetical protein CDD80_7028 [Ophiocordyceps camponoti-rufipedis]
MSRIQIPLDALTSRLNLHDRLQGFRPGPLTGRFSNLRPISEFLDFKRVSKPANFAEMQSRVNYNLSHFSSNYAVVFSMLSIYALLTNWVLLFDIVLVVVGMFLIGRLEGRDLEIGNFRASSSQLYTGLLIVAVPLGLIASPFSTLLWLIGASGVAILGHASFMDKPIDEAFSGEAGPWDGVSRVEELDTDGEDGLDVQRGGRFVSDSLRFTGIDLGDRTGDTVSHRRYGDSSGDDDDGSSTCSDVDEDGEANEEEKDDEEEALVQSALQRIDRARARGKADVRLNKDELAALERRRRRMHEEEERRRRRRRAREERVAVPLTHLDPISRDRGNISWQDPTPRHVSAGSTMAEGPEQRHMYPPMGYFPPPISNYPRQRSGVSTSTSSRHVSDSATRLRPSRQSPPDDDGDDDFLPRNRAQVIDPFVYQTAGPRVVPSGGRRYVSGPAEIIQGGRRGQPSYGDETSSDDDGSSSSEVGSRSRGRPARGRTGEAVVEASPEPSRKKGSPASSSKKKASSSGGKRRKNRPMKSSTPSPALSGATTATKRLLRELDVWRREGDDDDKGIERLGPVGDDGLLEWQAVINGRGIGGGYDEGRWLLSICIPPTYPLHPPRITFSTPIIHANVSLSTGEICLDLLASAWTPAYSVLECVRAVRMLLACPEVDSPLNVDVAALLRQGDGLGARRLVQCWCCDEGGRYRGP